MVQDSSPRRHAARRNNDRRIALAVEFLRLLARAYEMEVGAENGTLTRGMEYGLRLLVELGNVIAEQLRDLDRHRAVDIHGKIRDEFLFLQIAHDIQQRLGTSQRKRRHNERSSAL